MHITFEKLMNREDYHKLEIPTRTASSTVQGKGCDSSSRSGETK